MVFKITICNTCGKRFLQQPQETHQYCRICNHLWRKEQDNKREEAENRKLQEQRNRNQEIFEAEVAKYAPISMTSMEPSDRTLYIIGNGFDLMHRVPSSYYGFRDSLGKRSNLRWMLETTLTPDDIWADFENSLGNLNFSLMSDRHIVDMWLDNFGAYKEDAGAAEYYMAVEAAANPISSIVSDLQPAFRRWVSKLSVGTDDRPLEKLICAEGKVLNFNYTEFVETLYGAKEVCYIHGCRRNRGEELILGHKPGIERTFREKNRRPRTYRQAMTSIAQDNVLDLIYQYDEELTKNSQEIIKKHREFFAALTGIEQVIVIGHSLSAVDWDYFAAVNDTAPNAHWYLGIYDLNNLRNFEDAAKALSWKEYHVFRTDGIWTKPNRDDIGRITKDREPASRVFREGNTTVTVKRYYNLMIGEDFEMIMPDQVRKVIFLDDFILIVLNDLGGSLLLFGKKDQQWNFIAGLEGFDHQGLINRRLNHVFLTEKELTFVYNNRVRTYALATGEMIRNRQVKDAKSLSYAGRDVAEKFVVRH